jgi:hypothetical protein
MSKLDKILYVVAPVIGGIHDPERKEYDFTDSDPKEQIPYKTADELMDDFSNDEDGANRQYNNKVVRVIGIIKSIQQDNSQTIFLSTSSALCSIICHFPENYKGQLNHLSPWQAIVVKGLCTGILKHVVLENCELENI